MSMELGLPPISPLPPILVFLIDPLAILQTLTQVAQVSGGALQVLAVHVVLKVLQTRQQSIHVVSQVWDKTFCFVVEHLLIVEPLADVEARLQGLKPRHVQ
jgi:hypothetical protein